MSNEFTKDELNKLRTVMQKALSDAGIEGMAITVGSCRYREGEATFKVDVIKEGAKTRTVSMLDII